MNRSNTKRGNKTTIRQTFYRQTNKLSLYYDYKVYEGIVYSSMFKDIYKGHFVFYETTDRNGKRIYDMKGIYEILGKHNVC